MGVAVAGGSIGKRAGISVNWHARAVAGNPDVHGLIPLGIPRKNARRHQLQLSSKPTDLLLQRRSRKSHIFDNDPPRRVALTRERTSDRFR
jgi:hypothetical protein